MAFENAGGGQADLMALFADPQRSDALAATMAAHYSPPAGQHDFTTAGGMPSADASGAAMGAPPAGPPPATGSQMSLGDVPAYTPPPQQDVPQAKGAGGGDNYRKTAALAGFGSKMAQMGEPPKGPPPPSGGPRPGGQFTNLPPGLQAGAGIQPQAMTTPVMPPGQNPMVPPGMQTPGLPPDLAAIAGRYGQ